MKKTILCLLAVALLAGGAWSQDKMSGGVEKAVAGLEQQWLQSQKTNNPEALTTLLADKFIETSGEGKVQNKAEAIAQAKTTKYSSADYNDVKVTVYGDAAIATGGFKAKATDENGKTVEINERWTDTWVKMKDGKWQCVASQGTPVKM
jgi:uncharacterized protein (TIGR02246 family)